MTDTDRIERSDDLLRRLDMPSRVAAMRVAEVLDDLSPPARARVLRWAVKKFVSPAVASQDDFWQGRV